MKVSIFRNPTTIITVVEFNQVVSAIRQGTNQDRLFAPSGVINISGNKKNTLIYSGLVLLTFDANSDEELESIFQSVTELSTTYCCFKNHLGTGLNVLVKTDNLEDHHKTAYQQIVKAYEIYLNLKVSDNNPDVYVLCHLSYDPNIYYNYKSDVFQVDINTRKTIITEAQLIETYKEVYDEVVEYTKNIIQFEGEDSFIYTLANNCFNHGIPLVNALELIMADYGYDLIIKGIVKRAYRRLRQVHSNDSNPAFSVYLKNLRNYKEEVPLEKRILFEFFILTYIHFMGKLNFSEKQFRQELGIYFARKAIIKDFVDSGFLYQGKISFQIGNKKVPKNTFSINVDKVPFLAEKYMIDSSKFIKTVMPVLKGIQRGSGGYNVASQGD